MLNTKPITYYKIFPCCESKARQLTAKRYNVHATSSPDGITVQQIMLLQILEEALSGL